jgi:ElaB/YqjD/DUF883 family membrane-anchored ribosome-binding protein
MDETRTEETMTETMTTEEKRTAQEIRGDIRQTISEMGRTLDEIRYRLSPEEIKSKAKERVREATVGRAVKAKEAMGESMHEYQGAFKETLRDHPVPSALAGIGLGWFLMSMIKERKDRKRGRHYPAECHYYYSGTTGTMEKICPPGRAGMRGEMESGGEGLGAKTGEMKEKLSETAEEWKERMSSTTGHARERAHEFSMHARSRYANARDEMQYQMQDNPLSVGMLALAAGAVIGLVIPESRWEDRMMGQTRDDLLHQAREKGMEHVQKARHAMEETVEKSKETFSEEMSKEEEPTF